MTSQRARCLTLERNEKRAKLLDVMQEEVIMPHANALDLSCVPLPMTSLNRSQVADWIQNLLSCKPILPQLLFNELKEVYLDYSRI